ncbi:MAG: NYN domain-containing protein, partial [Myxococcota bacterium]
YENVAIGVRDAKYDSFDIQLVLERLLDKGKIVVKKAYADWERYKQHRRALHEAAFELIEIPHISYSGKNSADIRMVVDALDLCYTKSHVDVFGIISGDSDFSPLVSKLRENNKKVIGLGVKNSTSDLLIENCDDFIYYDDLVRHRQKSTSGRRKREAKAQQRQRDLANRDLAPKDTAGKDVAGRDAAGRDAAGRDAAGRDAAGRDAAGRDTAGKDRARLDLKDRKNGGSRDGTPREAHHPARDPSLLKEGPLQRAENGRRDDDGEDEARRTKAMEMVLDTVDALFRERDDNLWGSMVKQTLKRKRPNFSETFHGYRNFNTLLEDAQRRGLLEIQKDAKSGGYLILAFGPNA